MQEGVGKIIERRYNRDSLISFLSEELSGSELNSVMLEVHNRRAARTHPSTLLKQYQSNRFVHPAESNYFNLLEKTIHTLQIFQNHGFEPKHLSPLSVLGTCSVVGSVNQNKIISTIRNCEVLSDATNALALLVCDQKKKASEKSRTYKYSAAQRHALSPSHSGDFRHTSRSDVLLPRGLTPEASPSKLTQLQITLPRCRKY
jgi:hypothetical protein